MPLVTSQPPRPPLPVHPSSVPWLFAKPKPQREREDSRPASPFLLPSLSFPFSRLRPGLCSAPTQPSLGWLAGWLPVLEGASARAPRMEQERAAACGAPGSPQTQTPLPINIYEAVRD